MITKTIYDTASEQSVKVNNYPLTDSGNGQRLSDKFEDRIRYCPEERAWFIWDGRRWKLDDSNTIQELAKTLYSDLIKEAEIQIEGEDPDDQEKRKKAYHKAAKESASLRGLVASHKCASSISKLIVKRDVFNRHDHLLNCANGIVDLHTMTLLPHDPKLFLSYLCPTEFDPNAKSSEFDNLLDIVTKNHQPELPAFLKRLCGYIIQGSKGAERIVIAFGKGGTGKGTFWGQLAAVLDTDYAKTFDCNSMLKQVRGGGAASGDLARLEGCRFALISEFPKHSRVDEALLKRLSGGDKLVARELYKAERQFGLNCQMVFQTNQQPGFDSTDSGNQRRYLEIPFDNKIPNPDPQRKQQLEKDTDALKAMLAWAVAGSAEYQANVRLVNQGLMVDALQPPPCVLVATKTLFDHNDYLSEFFADCLVIDPLATTPVKTMSDVFKMWCVKNDHDLPKKAQTFNKMLKERNLKYAWMTGGEVRAWHGARLTKHGERLIEPYEETVKRGQLETKTSLQRFKEAKEAAKPDLTVFFGIDEAKVETNAA